MIEQDVLFQKPLNKEALDPTEVIISLVDRNGNYFYRALSLYLTNDQTHYKIIRKIIYQAAKESREFLKPFFLTDTSDDVLVKSKSDNYIEKMKKDSFYAGIIELSIATRIFEKTIIVYSKEEQSINQEIIKNEKILNTKYYLKIEGIKKCLNEKVGDILKSIIYNHLTTIEKPNERFDKLNNIIALLYDRNLRHFSLILTQKKDIPDIPEKIRNKNDKKIELFCEEDIIKYAKKIHKNLGNLKIQNGSYSEDLNTKNLLAKKILVLIIKIYMPSYYLKIRLLIKIITK